MTSNAVLLDKYQDYLAEKQFDILISLDGDEWGNSYRTGAITYIRIVLYIRMCGPIRIYVQAHAYIRVGSRHRMCD